MLSSINSRWPLSVINNRWPLSIINSKWAGSISSRKKWADSIRKQEAGIALRLRPRDNHKARKSQTNPDYRAVAAKWSDRGAHALNHQ